MVHTSIVFIAPGAALLPISCREVASKCKEILDYKEYYPEDGIKSKKTKKRGQNRGQYQSGA